MKYAIGFYVVCQIIFIGMCVYGIYWAVDTIANQGLQSIAERIWEGPKK